MYVSSPGLFFILVVRSISSASDVHSEKKCNNGGSGFGAQKNEQVVVFSIHTGDSQVAPLPFQIIIDCTFRGGKKKTTVSEEMQLASAFQTG